MHHSDRADIEAAGTLSQADQTADRYCGTEAEVDVEEGSRLKTVGHHM